MYRYYPHTNPKSRTPQKHNHSEEAELAKQEAAEARDRESIEAETRTREQMAMEAELESRSSAKSLARNRELLAHNLDNESPSPSGGNGYSLRKREPKNHLEERVVGAAENKKTPKTKKSTTGSSATPKTPKTPKVVKTPRTPKSAKSTQGKIKSPITPTPSGLARLVVGYGREATIQRFPRVPEETLPTYPKFVRFGVGPVGQLFAIPLQYLELECDFFRTEFSSIADKASPMDFPELDVRAFTMFTTWVYSNQLKELESIEESSLDFAELVRLYHIAEKFHAVVLKNVVIDIMIGLFHHYNGWVQFGLADEIYASTVIGSPLRRLWVEFRVRGEGVEQGIPQLNGEFLTDVVERQREILQDSMRGFTIQPIEASEYYDVEAVTGRTKGRIPFF